MIKGKLKTDIKRIAWGSLACGWWAKAHRRLNAVLDESQPIEEFTVDLSLDLLMPIGNSERCLIAGTGGLYGHFGAEVECETGTVSSCRSHGLADEMTHVR